VDGVARVLPDVPALAKTFDYLIPEAVRDRVRVGTMVRVTLKGRRVGGWVVAVAGEPATDRALRPLAKVTGWGPPPDLIDLAHWAAWRWAGRPAHFLRTASPPGVVAGLPEAPNRSAGGAAAVGPAVGSLAADALRRPLAVARVPPAADPFPLVRAAAGLGDALVLAPTGVEAALVAADLERAGVPVALMPGGWARAAAGGSVVVGTRAAAWAPVPRLAAVVVLDEHDEAYQQEAAPTWNARDVAAERARRAGVPCVLVSPCPSLESLARAPLLAPARTEERAGWPVVDVADRRREPPGAGLYSPRLVAAVREAEPGARVVCVLNRKGRARLLACAACGELARCEVCQGPVAQPAEGGLRCGRCGAERPVVCTACGATRLRTLRPGVTRVREELELLAGRPVAELTGEQPAGPPPDAPVLVGTEAVLHRVAGARVVAFLDFDQELMAPRYRAAEEALGLLARAARLVGGRDRGGRIVVQTRLPGHEAVDAALHADPGRLAVAESARRAALRFPPETALAVVSGAGAAAFVAGLDRVSRSEGRSAPGAVEVLGPAGDRWLVRAPDHRRLCDTLAAVRRPAGRLRVAVDPLRA
jgi:primosomal protein N' (replication factor Y)